MSAVQQMLMDVGGSGAGAVLYSRNWNDNSVANQTAYGYYSPTQSASGGQAHLRTGGAATAASSLNDSPSLNNFKATITVSAYAAERTGLIYRTPFSIFSAQSTTNFGFNYWAAVKSTVVAFGRGSNQIQEVTFPTPFSNGALVTLTVEPRGQVHNISVNGVLYISATDPNDPSNNYANLFGNFGLMSILTANDSLYDDLVVTA